MRVVIDLNYTTIALAIVGILVLFGLLRGVIKALITLAILAGLTILLTGLGTSSGVDAKIFSMASLLINNLLSDGSGSKAILTEDWRVRFYLIQYLVTVVLGVWAGGALGDTGRLDLMSRLIGGFLGGLSGFTVTQTIFKYISAMPKTQIAAASAGRDHATLQLAVPPVQGVPWVRFDMYPLSTASPFQQYTTIIYLIVLAMIIFVVVSAVLNRLKPPGGKGGGGGGGR